MSPHLPKMLVALLASLLLLAGCGNEVAPTPLPAMTVDSVAPSSLHTTGGTAVTITGTNFVEYLSGRHAQSNMRVRVCGAPLEDISLVSASERTLVLPPATSISVGVSGTLTGTTTAALDPSDPDVVVVRPDGEEVTLDGAVTCYDPAPAVSTVSVSSDEPSGAVYATRGMSFAWTATSPDDFGMRCSLDPGDGSAPYAIDPCVGEHQQPHTYSTPGSYEAVLTITDEQGRSVEKRVPLTVQENPNAAPVSSFTSTPTTGSTPLLVTFDSSASSDEDGTIVSYAWDFGDGGTSSDANPTHTYVRSGTFTVSLTVTDDAGSTHTSTSTIIVDASLNIILEGLPAGLAGAVRIDGPNGFVQNITTNTGLFDLEPGTYTITASSVSRDVEVSTGVRVRSTGEASSLTSRAARGTYTETFLPPAVFTVTVTEGDAAAEARVPYSLQNGSLSITTSGLPNDLDATFTVRNDSSEVVTDLTSLPPGLYVVDSSTPTTTVATALPSGSGTVDVTHAYKQSTHPAFLVSSGTETTADLVYELASGSARIEMLPDDVGNVEVDLPTGTEVLAASSTLYQQPGVYALRAGDVTATSAHDGYVLQSAPEYVIIHSADGSNQTTSTIEYAANDVPVADLQLTSTGPLYPGDTLSFSARNSTDGVPGIVRYDYSISDGTTLPDHGATLQHAFSSPGTFTVTVTVTDALGAKDSASIPITIDERPTIVTNTNDDGPGSLRYVLTHAPDGATITFDPAAFSSASAITLTRPIEVGKTLTVAGPGKGLLSVDGANATWMIGTRENAGITLSISDVTLSNGRGEGGDPGAIVNRAGNTLNLSDVHVTNATSATAGAVHAIGDTTITASEFTGNTSGLHGGALVNEAVTTLSGVTFSNNRASGGGAVFTTGDLTISGGGFDENSATASSADATGSGLGGAILHRGGSVTISGTRFDSNTAVHDGGAIATYEVPSLPGTLEIKSGANFTLNEADNGGAIRVSGVSVTYSSVWLTSNSAATHGGALYVTGSANGTRADIRGGGATFRSNSAGGSGGAVAAHSSDLLFVAFTFDGNTANGSGGAIHVTESGLRAANGSFTGNAAMDGGAVGAVSSNVGLVLNDFDGNTATAKGGAVRYVGHPTDSLRLSVQDTTMRNSQARDGAAMHLADSSWSLARSTLVDNTADRVGGAIINIGYRGSGRIQNSTIANNSAANAAGGIYSESHITYITQSTFAFNSGGNGSSLLNHGEISDLSGNIFVGATGTYDIVNHSTIGSSGYNIIERHFGYTAAPTDQASTAAIVFGASSTPTDNGGYTPTLALDPSSSNPAIDLIPDSNPACTATDQRRMSRPDPSSAMCDAGAYELQ